MNQKQIKGCITVKRILKKNEVKGFFTTLYHNLKNCSNLYSVMMNRDVTSWDRTKNSKIDPQIKFQMVLEQLESHVDKTEILFQLPTSMIYFQSDSYLLKVVTIVIPTTIFRIF